MKALGSRVDHVWITCGSHVDHAHAHVDGFPPKVKDLLSSNSRKQGLGYAAQVAVQARFIILAAKGRFTTQKPQPATAPPIRHETSQ